MRVLFSMLMGMSLTFHPCNGVVTGDGSKEHPFVIHANYYYYGLSDDEAAGFEAAILHAFDSNKVFRVKVAKGGSVCYARYVLRAVNARTRTHAIESAAADTVILSNQLVQYGNIVTDGRVGGLYDLGSADAHSITLDKEAVMRFMAGRPGADKVDVLAGDAVHEIGHNLGGVHGDPGQIMNASQVNQIPNPNCPTGGCDSSFNYILSHVDDDGTPAIVGRIDSAYNTRGGRYLCPRECKRLRDGSNGKLVRLPGVPGLPFRH